MKKILAATLVVLASTVSGFADVNDKLIDAIAKIESSGNSKAIGDHGKARGLLQIHKCVITDVNNYYGTKYNWHIDTMNPQTSRKICKLYLKMLQKQNPNINTDKELVRCWNGGPAGYLKVHTLTYLKKYTKKGLL